MSFSNSHLVNGGYTYAASADGTTARDGEDVYVAAEGEQDIADHFINIIIPSTGIKKGLSKSPEEVTCQRN